MKTVFHVQFVIFNLFAMASARFRVRLVTILWLMSARMAELLGVSMARKFMITAFN